jgi:hypothetical protein
MRHALALVLAAALAAAAPAARADQGHSDEDPEQVEARVHASEGQAQLEEGRFGEAYASFQQAYVVTHDARLLFKMGECQRRLGKCKEAIHTYQRYLASALLATNRAEVEADIASCQQELDRAANEKPAEPVERPRGLAPPP